MSKDQTALEQAAKNFGEAAKKLGAEVAKGGPTSSRTIHDSVKMVDGVVVAEEHWVKTTGDMPQDPTT